MAWLVVVRRITASRLGFLLFEGSSRNINNNNKTDTTRADHRYPETFPVSARRLAPCASCLPSVNELFQTAGSRCFAMSSTQRRDRGRDLSVSFPFSLLGCLKPSWRPSWRVANEGDRIDAPVRIGAGGTGQNAFVQCEGI